MRCNFADERGKKKNSNSNVSDGAVDSYTQFVCVLFILFFAVSSVKSEISIYVSSRDSFWKRGRRRIAMPASSEPSSRCYNENKSFFLLDDWTRRTNEALVMWRACEAAKIQWKSFSVFFLCAVFAAALCASIENSKDIRLRRAQHKII